MALIGAGTFLMIEKKESVIPQPKGHGWMFYAVLSAVFASLTTILGKVGVENIDSNLGTALRTVVVLVMAWAIVLAKGKQKGIAWIVWEKLAVPGFVRSCHRALLAVLLPGPAQWGTPPWWRPLTN